MGFFVSNPTYRHPVRQIKEVATMYELYGLYRSPEGEGGAGEGATPPPEPSGGEPNPGSGDSGGERTYTQEQLENLIKSRVDRLNKQYETKLKNREQDILTKYGFESEDDIARLNQVREEMEKAEQRKLEEKGKFDQILTEKEKKYSEMVQKERAEKEAAEIKYQSYRKRDALTNAALKAGADPDSIDIIVTFTERSVKMDGDEKFHVVDVNGEPELDHDTGSEITLDKFMKGFLEKRPNLLKSTGTSGAGTGASARVGKYTMEDIQKIASTDLPKYKELVKDGTVDAVMRKHTGQA